MKAAKAANPDAFVAWSYPPDTFALAEQAKIEGLNVKAYYSAVATALPGLRAASIGQSAENILGAGGIQDSPEIRNYYKVHKEVTGVDADYWGSPLYYAMLQMIEQAIEGVGSMDLPAITAHMKTNTYKTIIGEVDIRNQMLEQGLDRRPMAERLLPRRRRRRLHRLQADQSQDRLVSDRDQSPGAGKIPAPGCFYAITTRDADRGSEHTWTSSLSDCCSGAPTP